MYQKLVSSRVNEPHALKLVTALLVRAPQETIQPFLGTCMQVRVCVSLPLHLSFCVCLPCAHTTSIFPSLTYSLTLSLSHSLTRTLTHTCSCS